MLEDEMQIVRAFSALFVSSSLIGCASSGTPKTDTRAVLVARDSVHLAGGPVFKAHAVDDSARVTNFRSVEIGYTPARAGGPAGPRCHKAEVDFVVDIRGRPESGSERVVDATDPGIGEALLKAVPQYRFTPALKDGAPVRQIVRMVHAISTAFVVVRAGPGGTLSPPPPPQPKC
jgi:hypothetical protein